MDNDIKLKVADSKHEDIVQRPEDAKKLIKIGKGESIFRIFISLLIAAIFIGVPYIMGFVASSLLWEPETYFATPNWFWVPIFNLDIVNSLWFLVVLWTLVVIVGEIIKMIISRYNKKYALTTTITGALLLIFTGMMFLHPRLYNIGFVPLLDEYLNNIIPGWVAFILRNAGVLIFIIIAAVVVIEIILAWHKATKVDKPLLKETEVSASAA